MPVSISSCPEIRVLRISSVVLLRKTRIFLGKMDAYAVGIHAHRASPSPEYEYSGQEPASDVRSVLSCPRPIIHEFS